MRRTPTSGLLAGLLLLSGCSAAPQPAPVPAAVSTPAPSPTRPVYTLAALGDSYTQGFASCGRPGDCPTSSWATGAEPRVDSLLQRLARARGARPDGHNLSVSGARVGALARQALRASATQADLVVVLVGVNDVCTGDADAMTRPEVFARELERAFGQLDRGLPDTPVLVLSVPDLGRMADLGRDVPAARAVWDRHLICQPVFGPAGDRTRTDGRRRAFDAVLERVCTRRARCTWDGGAVGAHRFGPEFLSADWFHPSAEGQRTLADLAEAALQRSPGRAAGPGGAAGASVGPAGVEPALGRP